MAWTLSSLRSGVVSLACILTLGSWSFSQELSNYKHYREGILAFEFPDDWLASDKSNNDAQQINIASKDGKVLIIIVAFRNEVTTPDQFDELVKNSAKARLDQIKKGFSQSATAGVCLSLDKDKIPGHTVVGKHKDEPSTADSYSLLMSGRFVNVVYIRENRESTRSDVVWKRMMASLDIKDVISTDALSMFDLSSKQVTKGKLLKNTVPMFPSALTRMPGPREVRVVVTISKSGDVTAAKGIEGNPLLFPAAVDAAKQARFSPTLSCGEPVEVSATIVYKIGS